MKRVSALVFDKNECIRNVNKEEKLNTSVRLAGTETAHARQPPLL
jgi:hypothetical protein